MEVVIDKKFLSIPEVKSYLGSSRTFIYDLIAKKKLTAHKVGRRTYISTSELEGLFQPKAA